MKMTMSALAALVVTATDVRANETVGNTVRLPDSKDAKVTPVYQHALPGIPGKSVKGVLVEYGPAATRLRIRTRSRRSSSQPSSRERSAVRSTTGRKKTYRTGELPGDHHRVSANASETRPAKILAVFVVDDQDKMLRYPPKVRPLGRARPLRPST